MDKTVVDLLNQKISERKTLTDHARQLGSDLEGKRFEIQEVDRNTQVNIRADQVLKRIAKEVSELYLGKLQTLMEDALKLVFQDRDYGIDIEIVEKRNNNQIVFYLIEEIGDKQVKSMIRDEVGAGVRSVVGLIFQIYYINVLGLNRTLFIDEAFTEISDEYIESFFNLLTRLKESFNFRFLIITHDIRFHPYADKVYRVERGQVKEEKIE